MNGNRKARSTRRSTSPAPPRSKKAKANRGKALRKTISNGIRREKIKSGTRVKR